MRRRSRFLILYYYSSLLCLVATTMALDLQAEIKNTNQHIEAPNQIPFLRVDPRWDDREVFKLFQNKPKSQSDQELQARNTIHNTHSFTGDVAIPASFRAALQQEHSAVLERLGVKKQQQPQHPLSDDRLLQEGGPPDIQCQLINDGSGNLLCVGDERPSAGLVAFFVCPNGSTNLNQCQTDCEIFEADTPADVAADTPTCSACAVCPQGSATAYSYNCSAFSETACAVVNCEGQCLNPPRTVCMNDANGTIECRVENSPNTGLVVQFNACPITVTSPLQCGSCEIIDADRIEDITDASPRCNSCTLCQAEASVAFDCGNVSPGVVCATQDCEGICVGSAAPSMAPVVGTRAPSAMPNTEAPVVVPTTAAVTDAPVTDAPVTDAPVMPPTSAAVVAYPHGAGGLVAVVVGGWGSLWFV